MKHIFKTLLLTFLLASTVCFSQRAFSQIPNFVSPVVCMPAQDTTAVSTTYTLNTNGATVTSIPALGDLQIVSITPALPSAAATITIVAKSKNVGRDTVDNCVNYLNAKTKKFGFGRGVLRVFYTSGGCGSFFDLTINKLFNETPPIVGPKCVAIGDTITYSVCSILSVNQNANIGIDKYVWGTDNTPIPGLVRVYKSGDSSSVTYKVVAGWNGGTLSCKFGVCNSLTSTLTLGVKTKEPFSITINGKSATNNSTTCIRTGKTSIFVRAIAPAGTGYTYQWSTNNSNWGFGTGGTATATTTGTGGAGIATDSVSLSIKEGGGTVYLTTIGGCGTRTDTLNISRILDSTNLSIKRTDTTTCLVPVSNVTFSVNNATNNANLGNLTFGWFLPTGWSITGTATGSTITAVANANAISGTIKVVSTACSSDTLRLNVSVKPAKPSAITGTFCIPSGNTATRTYSVTAVPGATSYIWTNTASPAWTGTSTTNTITYTPSGTSVGTISVRAVSNTCLGDTVQQAISFSSVIPTNITQVCIPGGLACSTTLSAVGGAGTYQWIIPAGLGTPANPTGQNVTISTLGTPGTYTVQVRCKSACDSTAYFSKSITVSPLPKIDSTGSLTNPPVTYKVVNTGACTPSAYCWKQNNTGACVSSTYYITLGSGTASNYTAQVSYTGCASTLNLSTPTSFNAARPAKANSKATLNDATINPNPAKDAFTIVLPATNGNTTVSIYNSKGSLVKQQICKEGTNKFSTTNWANGEYIIKLTSTKGETVSKKLMVNK